MRNQIQIGFLDSDKTYAIYTRLSVRSKNESLELYTDGQLLTNKFEASSSYKSSTDLPILMRKLLKSSTLKTLCLCKHGKNLYFTTPGVADYVDC
jgi:hypothetical protein